MTSPMNAASLTTPDARRAECNRQAIDYLRRASEAGERGQPAAAREWMQAADAAMRAARAATGYDVTAIRRVVDTALGERGL